VGRLRSKHNVGFDERSEIPATSAASATVPYAAATAATARGSVQKGIVIVRPLC
jgi:hypothetical protein